MDATLKYDMMDPLIEDVYIKSVMLDEKETKALNERFGKVIERFIGKMKEVDDTFSAVFNRIHYTGSFFDGLRITEATEFDLNLVLKPKLHMELLRKQCPPGFVTIEASYWSALIPPGLKDWLYHHKNSNKYFLNPNAVRWWLHGVAMKALKELEKEGNMIFDCQLKLRQSGPAWTLSVTSKTPPIKTIDIDLVPVLEFTTGKRGIYPSLRKKDIRKVGLSEPWFAVPKPPTANCPCKMCISWRMSFPIQESAMIDDLKFFKYTMKMVKKVRDELGIHEVASYYIKNLFLLELQKNGPGIWTANRRGFLFMHMLERLRKALEDGKIPFLWNENCNLIGSVSKDTLTNSAGRLGKFCDKINRLVKENDNEQLKSVILSIMNPTHVEKKHITNQKPTEEDSISGTDSDSEIISHGKGLKAIETLAEYIHQQDKTHTSQDDVLFLKKWKEFVRKQV